MPSCKGDDVQEGHLNYKYEYTFGKDWRVEHTMYCKLSLTAVAFMAHRNTSYILKV